MSRRLTQNINFPITLRVLGLLLVIEAAFMSLPLAVALFYGESSTAWAFFYTTLATAGVGALMTFGIKPKSSSMRKREGLILTASIWVIFSLFGMIPFLITGTLCNPVDAFFETMAGFTTTGSSAIIDLEVLSHGLLFWRALMQWIGGMGIILFTLAVLPMLNYKGGIALFNAEVTGITHERLRPRVSQTAKDLWLIYIVLTLLLTLLLVRPMGWFDGVCHALTTMSTGGLSTKNAGINYWHSHYVYLVMAVFMFLGGINFTLLFHLVSGKWRRVMQSNTFKWYVGVTVVAILFIVVRMWYMGLCDNAADRWVLAIFDTIAAITSAGYTSVDYETKGQFITLVLMILMFFGGMAGSTSGGAKIDRFIVMLKNTGNEFYRILHSNSVTSVRVDGKAIPHLVVAKVIAFLSIYMMVMLVVAVLLTLMGMPIFDALYTSVSAISNQGLGYGVTAGSGAFGLLPNPAKLLLAFEMLVGRLELFTVLALFTRTFWLKD
ncbi:MAG: TrkH family potassium uptake protein [Muribaculaceae bacterium]|nr:TrkH family potassium uptake protein [Muribaculaceae bacterium]